VSDEPQPGLGGELAHLSAYLDFYRATCIEKCRSLPEGELRASRVPSEWTPLELLQHLALMERRWFVWGFLGEQVAEPWGDSRGDDEGRWHVEPHRHLDEVVALMEEYAARTRAVLATHDPDAVASRDGRFAGSDPPDLRWICFHVLQEYARHAGHLDIAVELAGGHVGE
jgi:hypothetical protein